MGENVCSRSSERSKKETKRNQTQVYIGPNKDKLFHIQYQNAGPQPNRFSEPDKFIADKFKLFETSKRNYLFDEPEPVNVSNQVFII